MVAITFTYVQAWQIPIPGLGLCQRPPSFACRSRTGGGCGRVPGPKESPSAVDVMSLERGRAQKETGVPQQCSLLVDASIRSTTWLSLPRSGAPAPTLPSQPPWAPHLLSVALGFLLILKCLNSLFPDTRPLELLEGWSWEIFQGKSTERTVSGSSKYIQTFQRIITKKFSSPGERSQMNFCFSRAGTSISVVTGKRPLCWNPVVMVDFIVNGQKGRIQSDTVLHWTGGWAKLQGGTWWSLLVCHCDVSPGNVLVPLTPVSFLPPVAQWLRPALVLCIKFAVIKESSCGIWTVASFL